MNSLLSPSLIFWKYERINVHTPTKTYATLFLNCLLFFTNDFFLVDVRNALSFFSGIETSKSTAFLDSAFIIYNHENKPINLLHSCTRGAYD